MRKNAGSGKLGRPVEKGAFGTVSTALLSAWHALGGEYVFLVPGAQITYFLEALNHHPHLSPVVAVQELSAAFMACGYARASGKPTVVASIGGPGAAYMVAAAQVARVDQLPVCFITGNISADAHGKGEFQDASPSGTNDSRIFREAIGLSTICACPDDVPRVIRDIQSAFEEKRPLHIQIPVDVQMAPCSFPLALKIRKEIREEILNIPRIVSDRTRVVLFLGARAIDILNSPKLYEFAKRHLIAVMTDCGARGMVPEGSLVSIGYVGFRSSQGALMALRGPAQYRAERVICVGVKEEKIQKYVSEGIESVSVQAPQFRRYLEKSGGTDQSLLLMTRRQEWLQTLTANNHSPSQSVPGGQGEFTYQELFSILKRAMPYNTRYCLDAGQVRLAGTLLMSCHEPKMMIQSDALSPMGFGLCASIGVKLASPQRPVVALIGDGSFRMFGVEISTARRYRLPIIFLILDNQKFASTSNWGLSNEYVDLPETDWGLFAESMGIRCYRAFSSDELLHTLNQCRRLDGPVVLWVKMEDTVNEALRQENHLEFSNWLSEFRKNRSQNL